MLSPQYVAGLFDGEGSITLSFGRRAKARIRTGEPICTFNLEIGLSSTYQPIVELLKAQFGGSVHKYRDRPRCKDTWQWRVHTRAEQEPFLVAILPFCIIKSKQIPIAINYLKTIVARGKKLTQEQWNVRVQSHKELWKLNARGTIEKQPKHKIPPIVREQFNPKNAYSEIEIISHMNAIRSLRKPHALRGKYRVESPSKGTLYSRLRRARKYAKET